jgi:hypothetical protein
MVRPHSQEPPVQTKKPVKKPRKQKPNPSSAQKGFDEKLTKEEIMYILKTLDDE